MGLCEKHKRLRIWPKSSKLLEQQLEFQKALEASRQSQAEAISAKLPKLSITKFDGTYENWLLFWNIFVAEIGSTDLSPVTKLAYWEVNMAKSVKLLTCMCVQNILQCQLSRMPT